MSTTTTILPVQTSLDLGLATAKTFIQDPHRHSCASYVRDGVTQVKTVVWVGCSLSNPNEYLAIATDRFGCKVGERRGSDTTHVSKQSCVERDLCDAIAIERRRHGGYDPNSRHDGGYTIYTCGSSFSGAQRLRACRHTMMGAF